MRNLFVAVLLAGLAACTASRSEKISSEAELLFTIHQEQDVYERSDYGEPPQFAIWLEDKETRIIRTVFVTYRTATGNFEGKAECPVSLPAWVGAFRKETGKSGFPNPSEPATDAVTAATPKTKEIRIRAEIPNGSTWLYYVEVNVSGDYNLEFPSAKSDGTIDSQGNGQPSIVYRGEIEGIPGRHSMPVLVGRTEQMYFSPEINPDLYGIDDAKEVFSMIKLSCLK